MKSEIKYAYIVLFKAPPEMASGSPQADELSTDPTDVMAQLLQPAPPTAVDEFNNSFESEASNFGSAFLLHSEPATSCWLICLREPFEEVWPELRQKPGVLITLLDPTYDPSLEVEIIRDFILEGRSDEEILFQLSVRSVGDFTESMFARIRSAILEERISIAIENEFSDRGVEFLEVSPEDFEELAEEMAPKLGLSAADVLRAMLDLRATYRVELFDDKDERELDEEDEQDEEE